MSYQRRMVWPAMPFSLRTKIKEKLHDAHTGIQSCLRRPREAVYWTGMNSDLTDHISKCDICSSLKRLLIDLGKRSVQMFLHLMVQTTSVVDYYSSYFEVDRLETKNAKGIAKKLCKQFSVHGIPNQLITDGQHSVLKRLKSFRPAASLKSSHFHWLFQEQWQGWKCHQDRKIHHEICFVLETNQLLRGFLRDLFRPQHAQIDGNR